MIQSVDAMTQVQKSANPIIVGKRGTVNARARYPQQTAWGKSPRARSYIIGLSS